MSYFFNPAARVEYLEHVAYYESRQPGLGARYLAAFDAAMVKLCDAPHRYKVEFPPDIRRYRAPVSRTIFFTGKWVPMLRSWLLLRTAVGRITGSSGSNITPKPARFRTAYHFQNTTPNPII